MQRASGRGREAAGVISPHGCSLRVAPCPPGGPPACGPAKPVPRLELENTVHHGCSLRVIPSTFAGRRAPQTSRLAPVQFCSSRFGVAGSSSVGAAAPAVWRSQSRGPCLKGSPSGYEPLLLFIFYGAGCRRLGPLTSSGRVDAEHKRTRCTVVETHIPRFFLYWRLVKPARAPSPALTQSRLQRDGPDTSRRRRQCLLPGRASGFFRVARWFARSASETPLRGVARRGCR